MTEISCRQVPRRLTPHQEANQADHITGKLKLFEADSAGFLECLVH